jgi:hypothetical protein
MVQLLGFRENLGMMLASNIPSEAVTVTDHFSAHACFFQGSLQFYTHFPIVYVSEFNNT